MKYPEIKQIIETMENAGYDYKSEISAIDTAITTVSSGASLGLNAHVKAMILALLSTLLYKAIVMLEEKINSKMA